MTARRWGAAALGLAALSLGLLAADGGIAWSTTPQESPSTLEAAREALGAGRYDDAIRGFRSLVGAGEAYPAADRGLVQALVETGEYEEAESAARESRDAHPGSPEMARALGAVLRQRGKLSEAETSLRGAVEGGASDRLAAELELATLRWERGEQDEALAMFDRFIDHSNRAARLTAEELTAVGTAVAYLGSRDPDLFRDASRAFEEAIDADPSASEPKVRLGSLFLDKYNSRDARALFREVLDANPRHAAALLGMARSAQFDGSSEALDLAKSSLETNPNSPVARAFLARLYLDLEDTRRAEEEARRALEANPASLEALSVLAAALYIRGDRGGYERVRQQVSELNPRYPDLFNTVAELAVRTHLYADAVSLARRAVELDPTSWRGQALLGLNLLRLGEMEEGRRVLETAFAGDPYNVWVKNTLDLLDNLAEYREVTSPRFRLYLDPDEAETLGPYMADLAEEAFESMATRYGYRPPTPVRLEAFSRHADFSVRTVGLAGFGALGVSFGSVLAMNSPSARERGTFNWGSTLWHEISHAFTLGFTEHRIPRWFSEGLAVHDERRARGGWGSDGTPDFLLAYRADRLRPFAELNYGFVRPNYPQQVVHSYYQASLICQMIEEQDGWPAILRMLEGYRDGLDTEAVIRQVFDQDVGAFDRRFRTYLEGRFGEPLAALEHGGRREGSPGGAGASEPVDDDFLGQLAGGLRHFQAGRLNDAEAYLERAKNLFPEYAGPDAPYLFLARIHTARGDVSRAIAELERMVAINEDHFDAHAELADLYEQTGDTPGAARTLDRLLYIDPFEEATHARLAGLYEQLGRWDGAVREREAIVGMDPVDRPGALYRLALAYHEAGRSADARRAVLQALEEAPNYEDALELLLRLREERP
ncbi:MAG: tetratricopeptide repeat protein [Gemmatimonadota bacterium]|nr:MAG: tetratricopeptide repeat protein [Gemmatimonadota bacterium]